MDLAAPVLKHLRSISEPCNIIELAHALGVLEPGDVVPDRLRSTMTGLVRHQQVKRVHNGDGVLRYSLAYMAPDVARSAAPAPAAAASVDTPDRPAPQREATVPSRASHRYETGVSARVLAALVPGAPPVRRTVIESRLSPPLTTSQVTMALQALRIKGLVVRNGTTSNAGWQRADGVMPAQRAAPSTNTTARLGAAHHALLQARLAIDAALQALEA